MTEVGSQNDPPEDDSFLVRFSDTRGLGWCADGQRRWFARAGLDFRRFVAEGLPARDLLATNDALARQLVEKARAARRDEG